MRWVPNPRDRSSSSAGSSSKRKQGMSGWPVIAEEVLPGLILPVLLLAASYRKSTPNARLPHEIALLFNLSVILAFVLDERMSPIPGEGTRRMGVKNLSVTLSFENETESKIRDSLLVVVQRRTDTIRSAGCRKQYDQ